MPRPGIRLLAALPLCALALACGCEDLATNLSGGTSPENGLLRGKLPAASRGTTHVTRLTDGIAAAPGDPWRTDLTAVLAGPQAFVTWDLGQPVPLRCAFLEADGNDRYTLSTSADGQTFTPLWSAEPTDERGAQPHAARDLKGSGRYLRLTAAGGDGVWSVAEVGAWTVCPARWPPPLAMQTGTRTDETVQLKLWVFAALGVGWVLMVRRRGADWVKMCVAVPVGVGVSLAVQVYELWPLSASLALQALAAVAAIVAAVVVKRLSGRAAGAAGS